MGELWFDAQYIDTETGAVSNELDATSRLEAGDATLRHIGSLLLESEFEKPEGSFRGEAYQTRRELIKTWTQGEIQAFGSWIIGLVRTGDEDSRLITQRDVRRLSVMGLGPSETRLLSGAGVESMAEYRNSVGLPSGKSQNRFGDWGPDEYAAYARRVEKLARGKPFREDYEEAARRGWGPGNEGIYAEYGGVSQLNELIWYPDVESMTPSDMVYWGVRVKRANQGMHLSTTVLEILSGRHRGPNPHVVRKNFGEWCNFTEQVDDMYDVEQQEAESHRKEKLEMYDQMVKSGKLPKSVGDLSEKDLFAFAGKYRLVSALAPNMAEDRKLHLVSMGAGSFMKEFVKSRSNLTEGILEVTADKFGVYDDIWQPDDGLRHLMITEDELVKKRSRDAELKRDRAARQKAS